MRDRPPRLATALLKRFGPHNDALAGDLREAYLTGKSAWWYWGQVLTVVGTTNDRLLIVRGVVVGWITLFVFSHLLQPFNREVMNTRVLDWLIMHLASHPFVMLYAVALWYLPSKCAVYLFSGWVVGSLHRSCRSLAVFAFTTTVLVQSAWATTRWFKAMTFVYNANPYLALQLASAALPLLILFGGSLSRRVGPRELRLRH
jgi:hypothetical protein